MDEPTVAPGTRLLLIRHGETLWNREERIQGHRDIPLTERGREQARRLAEWLAGEPIDTILSSDLQRARLTAEILAAGRIPVHPDPRLREASMGEFEGWSAAELRVRRPREFHAWRLDSARNRPPGGETLEEVQARCMAALAETLPRFPGGTIAVVTHGGPVRVLVCALLGMPLALYSRLRVENTAVSRLLFTERGAVLVGLNEVAHLRDGALRPVNPGWEEK